MDAYLQDASSAIGGMTVIDRDLFRPILIGVILTPTAVTWEKWISVLSTLYQYQLKTSRKKQKQNKNKLPKNQTLCPLAINDLKEKTTAKISVFPLLNINHSTTSTIKLLHSQ